MKYCVIKDERHIFKIKDINYCCETLKSCFEKKHWDKELSDSPHMKNSFKIKKQDGHAYLENFIVWYGLEIAGADEHKLNFCPFCGSKVERMDK